VTYRAEELIFSFFVNKNLELLRNGKFARGFHRRFVVGATIDCMADHISLSALAKT